ncbi:MAG: hypothetical protein LBR85_09460 [Oscillospiraceae bacterium]|nr:hypothetical protein [Oscillospiraceae bacterium]
MDINRKGEQPIMLLTEEQLKVLIPERKLTQDQFLETLLFDNTAVDFGKIADYDPEKEKRLDEAIAKAMA